MAMAELITSIGAVCQEASDLGPKVCILDKGSLCVDIELQGKTVSGDADVEVGNPYRANEV